jgi:hypothetical protein
MEFPPSLDRNIATIPRRQGDASGLDCAILWPEVSVEEGTAMASNGTRFNVGGVLLPRPFKIRNTYPRDENPKILDWLMA